MSQTRKDCTSTINIDLQFGRWFADAGGLGRFRRSGSPDVGNSDESLILGDRFELFFDEPALLIQELDHCISGQVASKYASLLPLSLSQRVRPVLAINLLSAIPDFDCVNDVHNSGFVTDKLTLPPNKEFGR